MTKPGSTEVRGPRCAVNIVVSRFDEQDNNNGSPSIHNLAIWMSYHKLSFNLRALIQRHCSANLRHYLASSYWTSSKDVREAKLYGHVSRRYHIADNILGTRLYEQDTVLKIKPPVVDKDRLATDRTERSMQKISRRVFVVHDNLIPLTHSVSRIFSCTP